MRHVSKHWKLHPSTPNLAKDFTETTSNKYLLGTWGLSESIITNQKYKVIIRTNDIKSHDLNIFVDNGTEKEAFAWKLNKIMNGLYIGTCKAITEVDPPYKEASIYQYPNGELETITIKDFKIFKEA